MDKVKQLLSEVGKQLDNQGFIAKIFLPCPEGYYRKTKSGIKHYSVDEVEKIREKARYKDNEIIIKVNEV